jgi:cephalosporin hydroxylase
VLVKDRPFIESYAETLRALAPNRVVEFGIFQGGSALFLTKLLALDKFVGIDITDPQQVAETAVATHRLRQTIRLYWNTAQDDVDKLHKIFMLEFADGLPDLVIDDASHHYGASRRTFEIAFPFLRKGGTYVIEDWAWAHWPHTQSPDSGWGDAPALSNLIFELTMLLGSSNLIERIEVRPGFVLIQKSAADFDWSRFSLDRLVRSRGRRLGLV